MVTRPYRNTHHLTPEKNSVWPSFLETFNEQSKILPKRLSHCMWLDCISHLWFVSVLPFYHTVLYVLHTDFTDPSLGLHDTTSRPSFHVRRSSIHSDTRGSLVIGLHELNLKNFDSGFSFGITSLPEEVCIDFSPFIFLMCWYMV